jgi:transcriptional regulator with XRE-family HTH domain
MKVHEKIRFLRDQKEWSQEQMAEKLGMTTQGYAKIERGKTDYLTKLAKIAETLDVDLMELLMLDEKNVVCFNVIDSHSPISQISSSSSELSFEIQKLQLMNQHYQEIIAQKNKDIERLETIVELLKKTNPTD